MKKTIIPLIMLLSTLFGFAAPASQVKHADWTQSAVIYEVNLRQYTEAGTFKAFESHLDELHALGVDILWFMPINPIGIEDRKGELGSYYSVKDYKAINPEYGSIEDFKRIVDKAHSLGMKVMIDWVANHTARDNQWTIDHPDWYLHDKNGKISTPFDWTDTAELDYDNEDMRREMVSSMKFWIDECDIDGFRCDVAGEVPTDFWNDALNELRLYKKGLFFLGEAENPALLTDAFDAYYGWELFHTLADIVKGKKNTIDLVNYFEKHAQKFPSSSIAMNFTTNHDENSWNGTEFEVFAKAAREMAALTFSVPGMPLIYSGQEVGNKHRLEFFKKDPIVWDDKYDFRSFYKTLIKMRHEHPSMYAPTTGAPMKILKTSAPKSIFAMERVLKNEESNVEDNSSDGDGFIAVYNFSDSTVTFSVDGGSVDVPRVITLPAWGYSFFFNNKNMLNDIERIEPPFWWTNMKTPLTLMVYGKDLKGSEVKVLDRKGMKISSVHFADSDNYLFIDLKCSPGMSAGIKHFEIKTKDGRVLPFNYEFKKRREGSAERKSYSSADVIYLLMPDRFADGNPENDSSPLIAENANREIIGGRHGGDLEGIRKHLDYIKDLGATTIWPTPILLDDQPSGSYHGYAIADYYKVDPRMGTNESYKALVEEAHEKGLKFIQDVVVNHCGTAHWWMKDLPFEDWISQFDEFTQSNFSISSVSDPHASGFDKNRNVNGWFAREMPDMNLTNPFVVQYLAQNVIWWIEYANLDGLRVDTYPYSDKDGVAKWTDDILNEYPNISIVGECWVNSPLDVAYWEGDHKNNDGYSSHLPNVMDFPLMNALRGGINENDDNPGWVNEGIKRVYNTIAEDYAYANPNSLLVFFSNHDTERIANSVGVDKMKILMTVLLTTRGIPQLYAGDEFMFKNKSGEKGDPAERMDFPGGWSGDSLNLFDNPDDRSADENELFTYTKKLLGFRQSTLGNESWNGNEIINQGRLIHFIPPSNSNLYVYFRYLNDNQKIMVIINNSNNKYIITSKDWNRYKEMTNKGDVYLDVQGLSYSNSGINIDEITSDEKVIIGDTLELAPLSSMVLLKQNLSK